MTLSDTLLPKWVIPPNPVYTVVPPGGQEFRMMFMGLSGLASLIPIRTLDKRVAEISAILFLQMVSSNWYRVQEALNCPESSIPKSNQDQINN